MDRRRITTIRQLELMTEFLEDHRDLALGRVKCKEFRATADRLWRECADLLNPFGAVRTAKEWLKVWNEQKYKVRGKLTAINSSRRGTGGGPNNEVGLSPLENRVAHIIGMDVGPLSGVMQDQLASSAGNGSNIEESETENQLEDRSTTPPHMFFEIPFRDDNTEAEESIEPTAAFSRPGNSTWHAAAVDSADAPRPSTSIMAAASTSQVPETSAQHAAAVESAETTNRTILQARRTAERRRTHTEALTTAQQQAPQQAQSSRSMLDESRLIMLRVEELRAQAAVNTSQAALQNSIALNTVADAFKLICESMNRISNQFCTQPPRQDP